MSECQALRIFILLYTLGIVVFIEETFLVQACRKTFIVKLWTHIFKGPSWTGFDRTKNRLDYVHLNCSFFSQFCPYYQLLIYVH